MAEPRDLRATVGRLIAAVVGVTVLALVAGWLFGRTSPERAASTLLTDLVISEPVDSEPLDPAAPTSGEADGTALCGVREHTVDREDQVATLAAGAVIVQYRPSQVGSRGLGDVRGLTEGRAPVLVAPNPDLGAPVVATAWTRRLGLDDVNRQLLSAFVTAYGDPTACAAP